MFTPAMREGVSASRVGVGAGEFASVLHFLRERFPAVVEWPTRLARGDVLDADGHALSAGSACAPGMLLWYWRDPPPEPRVPFEIDLLHHDDHLVVIDKPHFLPVTPGGRHLAETALVRVRKLLGIATLTPMHRLDRDTAGVLVFTVQPAWRDAYHALLRDRQVRKVYEAVAPWRDDMALPTVCHVRLEESGTAFMQMQVVPGEPNAETLVERIAPVASCGLGHYRLTPRTGRRHQLRAQMNALGLPIVNDRIYPELWPDAAPEWDRPLQLLSREFAFVDPVTGGERCFTSRRTLSALALAA